MSKNKIYILGAGGQLGQELLRTSPPSGLGPRAFGHDQLDVTNLAALNEALGGDDCALVVNCAAYTAVDKAESDVEASLAINARGAAAVARACQSADVPLIHISTEYIFDGQKNGPYLEDDQPSPVNVYGQGKAEAESQIRLRAPRHVILRTSWLFSVHGHNFVKTILGLAQSQGRLRVVSDQVGCPTPARDIAVVIMRVARDILAGKPDCYGTFHYCGRGPASRYEFARAILRLASRYLGAVPEVTPTDSAAFPTPAARPANCVLDCGKITRVFGLEQKPWEPGLDDVITELCAAKAAENPSRRHT